MRKFSTRPASLAIASLAILTSACATQPVATEATSLTGPLPVPGGYDANQADQFQWATLPDVLPIAPEARTAYAAALAQLATIYGSLSVEQYKQMYAQAVDASDPEFTGFNTFDYDDNLAAPGYRDFKTPNADTLYFNAWLDLSDGPVLITVPETDGRFYTVNFVDVFGNATNISTRTSGSEGGKWLIAPVGWSGEVPSGAELFRVTTPYQWILGRVFTSGGDDLEVARAYQRQFTIEAPAPSVPDVSRFPRPEVNSPADFLNILDFLIDTNGYPIQEAALVHQFRPLGVGGDLTVAEAMSDAATAEGAAQGYAAAWKVIAGAAGESGTAVGHWRVPTDIGRFGMNYLARTSILRATGANVIDEYYPFASYTDAEGAPLNGGVHSYEVTFPSAPPVDYFWSLTVYSGVTAELYPNELSKYSVGDRTPGLVFNEDGSLTLRIQHARPDDAPLANWLPVPDGPFYLLLRNQGAAEEIYNGEWVPGPVVKLGQP